MKRLIYTSLFLALVGTSLISCKKESVKPENNVTNNPSIAHRDIVIGFYFTWDEWGRANKNCHKAGLCNFRLEEIRIEVNCVPVFSKEYGELYVQIPVDQLIEFEDEQMYFYIDEDLYAVGPDGYTYMIPSGVYEFNPDLFEMGGFELPLIFIN